MCKNKPVKIIYFFFLLLLSTTSISQNNYWQQQVNYKIDVSLNDVEHSLQGFEEIQYSNNSNDTLYFIWFHIWPNAYKNESTAFSEQLLKNGRKDFYFSKDSDKGFMSGLNFKLNDENLKTEPHPTHIDIIKVMLNKPLYPKQSIRITTPFYVKLPFNFSRGGHVEQDYQITQWYPKPAVYDKEGWHEMPYLDQGEFYSEFGNYDVTISIPENYIVASTGELSSKSEFIQLKNIGATSLKEQPIYKQFLEFANQSKSKYVSLDSFKIKSSTNIKKLNYTQTNIHDFAWFASKTFLVQYDSILIDKQFVDVFTFLKIKSIDKWKKSIDFAKQGLQKYSEWVGAYPYKIVSVVEGSSNESSGGMEYPTITLITTEESGQDLDATIVHEIGHNWFYGMLANNERKHPWLDEGINTYYQKRYELEKYGSYSFTNKMSGFIKNKLPDDVEELMLNSIYKFQKDQPIETSSEDFTMINYGLIAYIKASRWVKKLETILGKNIFDVCMQSYFNDWKFKHVSVSDFKNSMEKYSNKNLDNIFNELNSTGSSIEIKKSVSNPIKLSSFFSLQNTLKVNYLNYLPVLSYNNYDKVGIGIALHNYQLPLKNLNFYLAGLYATGSKKINSIGNISYYSFKKKIHSKFSLDWNQYSSGLYTHSDNQKYYLQFQRFTPSVSIKLFPTINNFSKNIQFKWSSFLMNRDELQFQTISTPTGFNTIINTNKKFNYINQLKTILSDNKVLYPYNLQLQLDQSDRFVRIGFTAEQFFNYATSGGATIRFFAGKFIYTTAKTFINQFNTDPFHLNMSGPKGYEDYTNSNYFIGRTNFEGIFSQQIMQRDGFFKVRSDLLSNKIGKTDDWLIALNLNTTIPDAINFLNVLPIKLPVQLFFDLGTYAEAWKENPSTGKFIYDAGFQFSIFNSLVNIYVPILYSKVYSNYFKSTLGNNQFLKNISFSIDIQNIKLNKLNRELPF